MSITVIGVDSIGRHHFKGLSTDSKGTGSLTDADGNTHTYIEGSTFLYTDGRGGEDTYYGSTVGWVQTKSGGADITEPRTLAHERNVGGANQYGAFVQEWEYTAWAHGDGDTIITSNPALLGAVIITSALTGDAAIRDGTTAGGTLIYTVSTADKDFHGIKLDSGIFIDDNASAGTIIVAWRDQ